MRYYDIRRHLKPYCMLKSRATTINHAFAAAIAPYDEFDEKRIREAIVFLGQNPDEALSCVYCDQAAETWDHVHATVRNKKFSGQGHRIGNLLPCCKQCNSKKGNKDWRLFVRNSYALNNRQVEREKRIEAYLAKYSVIDTVAEQHSDYEELQIIRGKILVLLEEGDALAKRIREFNREN